MRCLYLEWLMPKDEFPIKAKYYENTVDSPEDGGQTFRFAFVDPLSKSYRSLFGNITSDRNNAEVTIRTNYKLPYNLASYIVMSNGECFQIVQCQKDYSKVSREALAMWSDPVGIEYVIRMVQIPNPWGVA